MYESPIKIIYGQMQTQLEGDILKAVMNTDIQVDKEELTRALQYDRDQYERGFADGYMNAQQELVRCKDCAHTRQKTNREQSMYNENVYICTKDDIWGIPKNEPVWGDSFCNDGERRTE